MYGIGEYARIAQVSKRLLRYYDEIGLFQPVKIDPESGHRYYSASQLPELNRILALKDLGLSLNQIRRFVRDDISPAEIQGMLSIKKAELEQQVLEELKRIRTIESRLQQIKDCDMYVRDVVVKQVPQQKLIGIRKVLHQSDSDNFFWSVLNALTGDNDATFGQMTLVLHEDGISSSRLDVEMGRSLNSSDYTTPIAFERMTLETRSLPSATMATFIPPAESCGKLLGYNAIATWAEANHYDLVGAARLVFLKLPQHPGDTDFITEIQFPIRKRKVDVNWQSLS